MSKLGSKAERNGKCKCGNDNYDVFEVRIDNKFRPVITLWCHKCDALWDSRSNTARKFVIEENYINMIKRADENRKALLTNCIDIRYKKIKELQSEISVCQKEIEELSGVPE